MRCPNCGYIPVSEPAPDTVRVGPVRVELHPRARMAVTHGIRWGIGALLAILLVGLDLELFVVAPAVGLIFLAVLIGAGAATFVYLEKDLFP